MKIVVDTTPLYSAHKTRGIGRYTRSLVESLKLLNKNNSIIQTSSVDSVESPDIIHYPYFDLFHSHLPIIPPGPVEVVTIHDLIPLKFPAVFKPGVKSGINFLLQRFLIRRVAGIITDSNSSKDDIHNLLKLPKEKIFVVPLGVDNEFHPTGSTEIIRVRKKYSLPKEFVLYVGDVNYNKNLASLIAAISKIPEISLAIVSSAMGNVSVKEVSAIKSAVENNKIQNRVLFLTSVPIDPADDLVGIYSAASVYVQPSLYEGFGLPILEAMACGVPVVSSNRSSLPEVSGGASFLVNPDTDSLAKGIKKVLSDNKLRSNLVLKGLDRVKKATWEKTARDTFDVYQKLFANAMKK